MLDNLPLSVENGRVTLKGDLKVYGILDAGTVRTTEVVTHIKYQSQFFEFEGVNEGTGCGLLWKAQKPKQFLFLSNPDRFWSSESINLNPGKTYLINNIPVLSENELGPEVRTSNLTKLGTLTSLEVDGPINFSNKIKYDPETQTLTLDSLSITNVNSIKTNSLEITANGGTIFEMNHLGKMLIKNSSFEISLNGNVILTINEEGKLSINNLSLNGKLFANADKIPGAGTFNKGDIVWNSNPRPGTHVGWICIAPGSPGTWKPFGAIEN